MNNLNPQEFENFLARLDPDRNRAAEEYELLRRKLVKFFERNQCAHVEELADETIDRVVSKLTTDEIRDLSLFAYGVARMVCLEAGRRRRRFVPLLDTDHAEQSVSAEPGPEERILESLGNEKYLQYLRRCLKRLPGEHQRLIMEYYVGEKQARIKQRKDLAMRRGVSIGALRSEANAVRAKLRKCVNGSIKRVARI